MTIIAALSYDTDGYVGGHKKPPIRGIGVSVKKSSDLYPKARYGIMQPSLTESVRG